MLGRLYEFADVLRHQGRKRHMNADHALGRRGEDIAHRHLQRAGIVIVARNYRMASGSGEIDLIGWEKDTLVFVEVKSRQTDEYGAPDRARRPSDFTRTHVLPKANGLCPFCAGQEHQTPPEILSYRENGGPQWNLRVVPNKFPALRVEVLLDSEGEGLYDRISGGV